MHNFIFEVAEAPVPQNAILTAESVPSWFQEERADAVSDVSDALRDDAIHNFVKCFGGACTRQGDALSFEVCAKRDYFGKSYDRFHAVADKLRAVTLPAFCGDEKYRSCADLVYQLQSMYDAHDATYIYLRKTGDILTMDHWVRTSVLSGPFFIGGVVDYHC